MSNSKGAIGLLIVFIISLALALPDGINVGIMILEAIRLTAQPGSLAYETLQQIISLLKTYAILTCIVTIFVIIIQAKKGNY